MSGESKLRDLWDQLSLEEREIVVHHELEEDYSVEFWEKAVRLGFPDLLGFRDLHEEDYSVEAWKKVVCLGLRDAETGVLTERGWKIYHAWYEVWRPSLKTKSPLKGPGEQR